MTVHGDGWSGAGGVRLYQCSGYPEDGESFWDVCEQASARTVNVDPPWQVDDFVVKPIVDSEAQDPFPPATVKAMGNGTFDCETVDSTCGIFAIEGDPLDFERAPRAPSVRLCPWRSPSATGSRRSGGRRSATGSRSA